MNHLKRISVSLYAAWIVLLPSLVFAASCTNQTGGSILENPLSICSIVDFIELILKVFMMLMLPVIAFFIVLAGFNFVFARGKPDALAKAKWNFLFVVIGTCLILGAWLLANLIGSTVQQVTG